MNNLHLVLEYCPGGDVATQLVRFRYFSQTISKFYMTEIIMGLEELH